MIENENEKKARTEKIEKNQKNQMNEKKKKIIKDNIIRNANKTIRGIEELGDAPYSFAYFLNIFKKVFVNLQDVSKNEGRTNVGIYCVMVPEEIVLAFDALPFKMCCGNYTLAAVGDEFTPRDACPLVKAIAGGNESQAVPLYQNCEFHIIPTTCDCKRKLAKILSNKKNVYCMHVPALKDKDYNVDVYVEEIYGLIEYLKEITGKKLSIRQLENEILKISEVQKEIYRLFTICKNNPSVVFGTHVISIMNSYAYVDSNEWGDMLRVFNNDLEKRIENKEYIATEKTPRILITGSPIIFPNLKIPMLIESSGGVVVIDETCAGSRWMYDPVVVTENSLNGMIRALAARYILPCTCPTFVDNKQRIYKLKQMIEDFKIDGVVYHVLRGCLPYDFEVSGIERELADMDIPSIRVETDYNEEDIEQLRIRFEAFMEIIKLKH